MNDISIYETEAGAVEVRLEHDTIWLSQEQMAALFDVQKAAISKHLKNIYTSGELQRTAAQLARGNRSARERSPSTGLHAL